MKSIQSFINHQLQYPVFYVILLFYMDNVSKTIGFFYLVKQKRVPETESSRQSMPKSRVMPGKMCETYRVL